MASLEAPYGALASSGHWCQQIMKRDADGNQKFSASKPPLTLSVFTLYDRLRSLNEPVDHHEFEPFTNERRTDREHPILPIHTTANGTPMPNDRPPAPTGLPREPQP